VPAGGCSTVAHRVRYHWRVNETGTTKRGPVTWLAAYVCTATFLAVVVLQGCGTAGTPPGGNPPPPPPPAITVTISPVTASVPAGGAQEFTVTVTNNGSQSADVTWSVNGVAGGNATLGTIASTSSTTALYTAPAAVPSPSTVTVKAVSVADAAKSASASVAITCSTPSAISPSSANVGLAQTQSFTATFCLAANATIAWDVNGITAGNATIGTITPTGAATALYTAPADVPPNGSAIIHATASATTGGAATSASATVTITSGVTVMVTPNAVTVAPGQRQSFAASVTNSPDTAVTWAVNGIPNGNATVGQVCVSGSNPCVAPTGAQAAAIDYLAPASAPSVNPVTLTATSNADPSKTASASITIFVAQGPVSVTIAPAYAFVAPSGATPSTRQFTATVSNSVNTSVTWSVQGGVAGQGCAGSACGSVTAGGLYTAPSAAPSPNSIAVIATSAADSTKSATAMVAVANGPMIEVLLPSSVMAGAVESFPLEVKGLNFVAGSGTGASVILLNGTPRASSCSSATVCATALNPADVQAAGTVTVQVQNPGNPGPLSNAAPFVVAPYDVSVGTISLMSSQPVAAGADVVVTEPTTAAETSPINIDFADYLIGANSCSIQGSPLKVTRPASGSAIVSICVHGSGLDPTFTYAFSGPGGAPGGNDIGVTPTAVTGLLPNMIELDLQISASTLPGVRSLFVTTLNNDRAVATGILEVK
jgi:hypothetical protein